MIAALGKKRGEAFRVSLHSLVNYVWVHGNAELISKPVAERLVSQLVEIFDQLPVEQQADVLDYRWEQVKSPALLPLIKRCAQSETTRLAAIAIRRWFELNPAGARPAIISEISRPKPRFGARELGMLPDETLPEVDQALSDHLDGDADWETASNLASLIERYATGAILPQVLTKLDPHIGKWSCAVQNPLLAYVLRVDPEAARSRIEKAMAARGEKFSACNRLLLREVSQLHYDPMLEQIAIRALDDHDQEIATTAAETLAAFGSPAAEAVLWERYEKWCKQWAGRELQVNVQAADANLMGEGGSRDVFFGRSLVSAIVNGRKWGTDEPKLQRLRTMSKVPTITAEIDEYLEKWRRQPLALTIYSCGPATGVRSDVRNHIPPFNARVVHYSFDSFSALKETLSQFPSTTEFELSGPWEESGRWCADDLRAFLTARGVQFTERKRTD